MGDFLVYIFLILAIGKSHFPPPFEKWFFELALIGVWVMVLLCKKQVQAKDFCENNFLSIKIVRF